MNELIQSSKDILFLALAVSVVGVAFFICWSLYLAVLTLRDVHAVVRECRSRIERVWDVLGLIKEKLQMGGTMLTVAVRGLQELVEYFNDRKQSRKTRKRSKSSSDEE